MANAISSDYLSNVVRLLYLVGFSSFIRNGVNFLCRCSISFTKLLHECPSVVSHNDPIFWRTVKCYVYLTLKAVCCIPMKS